MTTYAVCALFLLVFVALGVWYELRAIRMLLQERGIKLLHSSIPVRRCETSDPVTSSPPLAVWIHHGARWHLDPTSVPSGYEAGPPPDFAGSYQEQRYRVECVPRTR